MTLQTDLQTAVNKATLASDKLNDIVNGDSVSTVTTDNGEVKTIAKAIADNEAVLATSIADVTTKRDEAVASATAAATSENNATVSETNAGNSASAAALSETNSANSATSAATSLASAQTAETNASASETASALSETNAGNSATSALNSANSASTSEANSAISEVNALASEVAALASANAAASSAAEGLYRDVISKVFADSPLTPLLSEEGTLLFRIDTSGGNVVVNLSDLATYAEDMKYAFVKVTADTNTITINRGGTDTIDGGTSTIINKQYEVNVLIGDSATGTWIKAVQTTDIPDGSLTFAKLSAGSLASQAEAEAGIATNKLLTPERVKQAINALSGGGGKILQIVSATDSGPVQVTTTALVNTGLTATITPSSTSSKILIFANLQGISANSNGAGMFALIRGSTNIHTLAEAIGYTATTTSNFVSTVSCSKEDSPNTTAAVTYKIQAAAKLGSLTIHNYYSTSSNVNSSIILMEVGA